LFLNARRLDSADSVTDKILIAIEDSTQRQEVQDAVRFSKRRFRRLFETAATESCWR